jgi:hypothetical protein
MRHIRLIDRNLGERQEAARGVSIPFSGDCIDLGRHANTLAGSRARFPELASVKNLRRG